MFRTLTAAAASSSLRATLISLPSFFLLPSFLLFFLIYTCAGARRRAPLLSSCMEQMEPREISFEPILQHQKVQHLRRVDGTYPAVILSLQAVYIPLYIVYHFSSVAPSNSCKTCRGTSPGLVCPHFHLQSAAQSAEHVRMICSAGLCSLPCCW